MMTSRPIRARISRGALLHNYRLAKNLAPAAKAWAVIKADAYGHGLWRAVETLREVADGFAVLECENAIALREAGVTQPILLLEGIFSASDVRAVVDQRLTTVVHCLEQLELLLGTAPRGAPLAIYLKLNTGMNRLGFVAVDLEKSGIFEHTPHLLVAGPIRLHTATGIIDLNASADWSALTPETIASADRVVILERGRIVHDLPAAQFDLARLAGGG